MTKAIDMHCDSLMLEFFRRGADSDVFDSPDLMCDVKRLIEGGAMAQCFAVFIPPEGVYKHFNMEPVPEDDYIAGCFKVFNNTIARHSDVVARATNLQELEENTKNGKFSMILTMEDGVAIRDDMSKLDGYYDAGVRALSLTWNFENCIGWGTSKDPEIMAKGLKPFGKEVVKHMQDIGMLVDVSHLNDAGFWDVVELAKVPFVATHSNARALCGHQRNMTDEMIKALADKGGIMGINFGHEFLQNDEASNLSAVKDMVAMALHEKEIAGVDVIAIGTDFDGVHGEFEVPSPDKMYILKDALVTAGFTTDEVDKIMYGNFLRVMGEAVK